MSDEQATAGMIVVVSGSRRLKDPTPVEDALKRIDAPKVILFHGGQAGADTIAGHYATHRGWEVVAMPADWASYNTDAGPIRNVEMLLEAKKRAYKLAWHLRLFAFPAPDARGTTNCIGFAQLLRVSHTIVKVTP